jgi:outer membrane lipoprotein
MGYRSAMRRLFILIIAVSMFSGCAHVISKGILHEVDTRISFAQLREDPQAYKGKMVLLGGVIVKTMNKKEGTLLEVYQTEMDRRGKPINLDVSSGRFLALYEGLLEKEIYEKGRKITIAGIVRGVQVLKLGEMDYRYPSIMIKDIHLWKKEEPLRYEPYPWSPWSPWWDPWYPWHPWHDPFWRYR